MHDALQSQAMKRRRTQNELTIMFGWILTLLVLVTITGYFGFFAPLTVLFAGIAKVLFLVALVMLVMSFVSTLVRDRSGDEPRGRNDVAG